MNLQFLILRPILVSTIFVLFGTGLLFAAELDDSALFVEAFNAVKSKDYLLAIEKIDQLNQLFPDTPLRDVSMLLLARAAIRSGDNALAASTANRFIAEFSDSSILESLDAELITLGRRQKNGEEIDPTRSLQIASRKVRDEQLANERAGIKLTINLPESPGRFEVDGRGRLLFELINKSGSREEFQLKTNAAPEYSVRFSHVDDDMVSLERVLMSAGKKFKGVLSFKVPHDRIDGYKMILPIKAVSGRFPDVSFSRDVMINVSAPLIRAVVKTNKVKVNPGEPFQYKVTLINAGSMAARKLAVRIELPEQLEIVGSEKAGYKLESDRVAVYWFETLVSGGLKEVTLHVKVKENVEDKADVRCQVEVNNEQLKHKSYFGSIPVSIVMH